MPVLVVKGEPVEVYTKDEVDGLMDAMDTRVTALETGDFGDFIMGTNGVRKLWAGTEAELAAIPEKAVDTLYVAT